MTDRDRFLAAVYNQPLAPADAIALFVGEDNECRVVTALELFKRGAGGGILVTGGPHREHRAGAAETGVELLSKGVKPDRLLIDPDARHTRAQADTLARLVVEKSWTSALLVASAYHLPRVVLTCVKALADAGTPSVRLIPVAATAAWSEAPDGMTETRLDLFDRECAKVREYAAKGDCASWGVGVEYLQRWEGK